MHTMFKESAETLYTMLNSNTPDSVHLNPWVYFDSLSILCPALFPHRKKRFLTWKNSSYKALLFSCITQSIYRQRGRWRINSTLDQAAKKLCWSSKVDADLEAKFDIWLEGGGKGMAWDRAGTLRLRRIYEHFNSCHEHSGCHKKMESEKYIQK